MLRLIIGFPGSQVSGPAKALYLGHSAIEAQSAVDAAQGFEAVHIAEIAHTRKARRSPGLPPVSEAAIIPEGTPVKVPEDVAAYAALLEESEAERVRLAEELASVTARLNDAVANIATLEALAKPAVPAEESTEKVEAKSAKSKKTDAQPAEEPAVKPASDGAPSI